MMNQSHKVLEDLGDELLVRLEEDTVSDANLHVLEQDSRMGEAGDAYRETVLVSSVNSQVPRVLREWVLLT